jgi:hypothetical protein
MEVKDTLMASWLVARGWEEAFAKWQAGEGGCTYKRAQIDCYMAVECRNSASPIVVVIEDTCAWRRLHLVLYYDYIGMAGNFRLTDEKRTYVSI